LVTVRGVPRRRRPPLPDLSTQDPEKWGFSPEAIETQRWAFAMQDADRRERALLASLPGDRGKWVFGPPQEREDDDGIPPLALRVGKTPDGRLICTGLLIGPIGVTEINGERFYDSEAVHEVTARTLRRVKLGELLNEITEVAGDETLPDSAAAQRIIAAAQEGRAARRPGPKGYPAEHFANVANAYRQALMVRPLTPIKYLAEQLGASEASIHRWLRRARDMGLLDESGPRRTAETPRRTK